jgi:hypothetical protein
MLLYRIAAFLLKANTLILLIITYYYLVIDIYSFMLYYITKSIIKEEL